MLRDPLSLPSREAPAPAPPVAMTAPSFAPRHDVPVRPSGLGRLDDGILEITTGAGLRVALRDVLAIGLAPALGGRLLLTVSYRDGVDVVHRRAWVAAADHDDLRRLVTAARAGLVARDAA